MKKILFTLIGVLGFVTAMAQWSDDPSENNRITLPGKSYDHLEFKVNKDGVTYITFLQPYRAGVTATRLQILDKNGKKIFPDEGKIISEERTRSWNAVNDFLSVDNEGNAIIVVSDCRNAPSDSDELTYAAYKVSPAGEMLWGDEGIDLLEGRSNSSMACIQMAHMDDNSTIFAWMQRFGVGYLIAMQRLSSTGELLWEGVELKDEVVTHTYPYMVNAGNNQVILVYAKGSNNDIYARKIDFDGEYVWPEDTRIYRGGFTIAALQTILCVVPDNNGGVFVGWNDDRFFTNKESTFVSHVKSNGTLGFSAGEDGQQVGYDELRGFQPSLIYSEKNNCLYVVWRETSASQSWQRITAQKIAMTGELLWGPNGIEVSPLEVIAVGYYSAQLDADENLAVFYQTNESYLDVKSYVTILDGKEGGFVWDNERVMFTTLPANRSDLRSSPLIDNSYWLTIWNDIRLLPEEEIEGEDLVTGSKKAYMQKVNMDGTLGGAPTSVDYETIENNRLFIAKPTVMDVAAHFEFDNPEAGNTDISIYSITGQKMAVVFNGYLSEGLQNISWNVNIPSGIYVATLTTVQERRSIRIIIK